MELVAQRGRKPQVIVFAALRGPDFEDDCDHSNLPRQRVLNSSVERDYAAYGLPALQRGKPAEPSSATASTRSTASGAPAVCSTAASYCRFMAVRAPLPIMAARAMS